MEYKAISVDKSRGYPYTVYLKNTTRALVNVFDTGNEKQLYAALDDLYSQIGASGTVRPATEASVTLEVGDRIRASEGSIYIIDSIEDGRATFHWERDPKYVRESSISKLLGRYSKL